MNSNFIKKSVNDISEVKVINGIFRKTLVNNPDIMMVFFRLEKGAELPLHSHPHLQIGYIISGKLEFYVNGKSEILKSGDSYLVERNIEHGAKVLEDTYVIDIFQPSRDDYK